MAPPRPPIAAQARFDQRVMRVDQGKAAGEHTRAHQAGGSPENARAGPSGV
jgi:hypothetical protein